MSLLYSVISVYFSFFFRFPLYTLLFTEILNIYCEYDNFYCCRGIYNFSNTIFRYHNLWRKLFESLKVNEAKLFGRFDPTFNGVVLENCEFSFINQNILSIHQLDIFSVIEYRLKIFQELFKQFTGSYHSHIKLIVNHSD